MKIFIGLLIVAFVSSRPQSWAATKEIVHYVTGDVILVNDENIDINGCLVGPGGEKVCPQGAIGSSGQDKATFRGNVGHRGTGSNGNASPIGENGRPVDPAAIAYANQIAQYIEWEKRQLENAQRQQAQAEKIAAVGK